MPLYFFDTRDGDTFPEDDWLEDYVGVHLPDLEAAKVRDEHQPMLRASLHFGTFVIQVPIIRI